MKRKRSPIENHWLLATFVVAGMTIFSLTAGAQSVALKKTMTGIDAVAPKAWLLPISMETGSTMHQEWSHERESYSTISLSPSYRITPRLRVSASTSLSKEHSGIGDTNFDNTSVAMSYLTKLNDRLNWSVGGGGILPTNPPLREQTSYQGAVRLNTGLSITDLYKGGLLNLRLSLGRNFHGYSQSADGNYNIKQTIGQSLDYTQPLGKNFSLTTVFSYTMAWTYIDDQRYSFLAGADISYQTTDQLSLSIGTANQGSALRPNGRDSNIRFFNDETSIIKMGLTYVL